MDLGFTGGRIVLIFGWVGQKVAILVWCSENVLILGMARVRSGDFMYRSGFVSNPVDKTLICGDFLFNPNVYSNRFFQSHRSNCVLYYTVVRQGTQSFRKIGYIHTASYSYAAAPCFSGAVFRRRQLRS